MEDAINLREIFQGLRKRLLLIIFITLLGVAISAVVSFYLITPKYLASTTILVNESKNNQNVVNSNETLTSQTVMSTYSVVIKSSKILNIVSKQLEAPLTTGKLKKMITVGSENESQVLSISVEDTDPIRAAKIANTTADVFQKEIVKIMKIDNVSILDKAQEKGNFSPISPKTLQNILIGFVIGLVIGMGLAVLIDYFDNTIKNEQDIDKILEIPVLGVVSKAKYPENGNFDKKRNRKQRTKGESISV